MALLIATFGVLIIGIIVFGGGQVFMPLFQSLWKTIDHVTDDQINHIFTIANSTPGVVSTKFSLFTGYLAADGAWWGWLAMILTFLIFVIPSILMIWWAYKLINKSESSKHLKMMTTYLKPVIGGIVIALAIQLFIGTAFPKVVFNASGKFTGTKDSIFTGWRLLVLIPYSIIVSIESAYLYARKKVNIFWLIIFHIILGMIIFEPWLM